jgi:hypothetical protein
MKPDHTDQTSALADASGLEASDGTKHREAQYVRERHSFGRSCK